MTGPEAVKRARHHVRGLTGKEVEGVIGLEKGDDGWTILVDVLELERVPQTTDVLATYEVLLDDDGGLSGCRRLHRYVRGSTERE
ncbi:gas vesicle protein GvpO [Nocardioides bizhenqiangii]|uniref:Gas vesicle protein n=1 Tax=Nocardioides bizhenqiangii TaxID=3095076 RepID=A0ABZ0ZU78_9ACTN|nr:MULTISPECIES: gas vesicle protein [unclassified Nocardioides]MDZ5621959.1 gas vesicle protein [Nocardioides sp. HM23]WQQ27359.1 gas vesicle protein [Nocardioides sp. HM61]